MDNHEEFLSLYNELDELLSLLIEHDQKLKLEKLMILVIKSHKFLNK